MNLHIILDTIGSTLDIELERAKSSQFPTPAERPMVSVLDCGKFEQVFGLRLPEWREALQLAMDKR